MHRLICPASYVSCWKTECCNCYLVFLYVLSFAVLLVCSVPLYCTVPDDTVLYCTVLYCTVLYL